MRLTGSLAGAASAFAVVAVVGPIAAATAGGPLAHRTDLSPDDRGRVARVLAPPTDFTAPEPFEAMAGGAATSRKLVNRDAFSQFSATLAFEDQLTFKLGNALFRKFWVSSPSSTQASDGLGPLFNARACQNCHLKDGRGQAPREAGINGFLMRLSVPANGGKTAPEPTYGEQLQDLAVPGFPSEGRVRVTWRERPVALADGTMVMLRKPDYEIADLGFGPMAPSVMMSPRVATPMIGLGLLEAIHPGDILANADPDDRNEDGISGRVNEVVDDRTGTLSIGRFGWKAGQPTVEQQSAHAFSGDMGLSTPLLPAATGDCTGGQSGCFALPDGVQERHGAFEVSAEMLALTTFYAQHLAVPVRRAPGSAEVLAGKAIFHDLGCASCHVPNYVTRRDAGHPALAFQLIWPYTDLLLHDMGEDLADHRPEAAATGREWRTPPLWGIGLGETVSGHTEFLHDGRARNLTEAILWHGGEAEAARSGFAALPKAERDALLAFLNSL